MTMRTKLRRMVTGGLLLREVRSLRQEMQGIHAALLQVVLLLEERNAHEYPRVQQPNPNIPAVEIAYVDNDYQLEMVDIEARLTLARGLPPTEEEILAEYIRRHPDGDIALNESGGLRS